MRLSTKLHCGGLIPYFKLPDTQGTFFSKDRLLRSSGLCLMFLSDTSFYVQHIREVLIKLIQEYQLRGLSAAAIYPLTDEDSACSVDQFTFQYPFPCLIDRTQEITRHFGVTRIPDFFLFDKEGILQYHGRMDGSKPENFKPVTGNDLRDALNALFLGHEVTIRQRPGFGTPIKWKNHGKCNIISQQ